MAGSQKITLWGPQRTPLGILRVKVRLVGGFWCDRRRQTVEKFSHILYYCKALAVLRFRRMGHHCLKTGDFDDIINQVWAGIAQSV